MIECGQSDEILYHKPHVSDETIVYHVEHVCGLSLLLPSSSAEGSLGHDIRSNIPSILGAFVSRDITAPLDEPKSLCMNASDSPRTAVPLFAYSSPSNLTHSSHYH